jgi:hypothetical protein
LPPLQGPTDVLDITCPHCDEEVAYLTPPAAQVTPCSECGKPMWLPGREEVERATAHLAPRPRSIVNNAVAQPAHESANIQPP